ncbi:MAG TPA: hypothetical protein VFJ47_06805 [Terriglobales bacterium]|nr:hypothetical protein [Terriglobales bacterium]
MRSKILLSVLLTALFVLASGCGSVRNCPVCGTTLNDGYTLIDVMPVPEHNPTGEPGGPFNSFDISVTDSVHHRFYVSDRIGLDIPVFDTVNNVALNAIMGDNGVAGAGDFAAPCDPTIPPLVTGLGNLTRFACRTDQSATAGGVKFHIPAFGASGHIGGFPGAQCCAARANGVNPLSAPDGEQLTADGNTLFVGNGSSSVAVFDLTTMSATGTTGTPPTVIADIPTGFSPDYDGCLISAPSPANPCLGASNYPNGAPPASVVTTGTFNNAGINPCIASANGRAFSDPTCGDLRADEMSYDEADHILLVANGDPGFPFVTLIDVSGVVGRTSHCLPAVLTDQPYMIQTGVDGAGNPVYNFPTCILGQIYYDGAAANNKSVVVDDVGPNSGGAFPCPDPSTTAPSGASGHNGRGVGVDVPCHHGPMLNPDGTFCANQAAPVGCAGAVAVAGIGGSAFNPNSGMFLVTNSNSSVTATATINPLTIGSVDVIDPKNPSGPAVVNSFPMPNCIRPASFRGRGTNSWLDAVTMTAKPSPLMNT